MKINLLPFRQLILLVTVVIGLQGCNILNSSEKTGSEYTYLFPVQIDGEWGFINKKGTLVLEGIEGVDNYSFFVEDRAVVQFRTSLQHYSGVIDLSGKLITDNKYQNIQSFSEGRALVSYADRVGYIDRSGTLVIPLRYAQGTPFYNDHAFVQNLEGQTLLITKDGEEIYPPDSTEFIYTTFPPEIKNRVVIRKESDYGYTDILGNIVIEPRFEIAFSFSENRACVFEDEDWKYIDTNGNEVVSFGDNRCINVSNSRSFIRDSSSYWALIDEDGNRLTDHKYSSISFFTNQRAIVQERDSQELLVIDPSGNEIFRDDFRFFSPLGNQRGYINGLLQIQLRRDISNSFGYIDTTGNYVWYPSF